MDILTMLWEKTTEEIQKKIQPICYITWFETLEPIKFEQNTLFLSTPNEFYKMILEDRYYELIKESFEGLIEEKCDVCFIVDVDEIS